MIKQPVIFTSHWAACDFIYIATKVVVKSCANCFAF